MAPIWWNLILAASILGVPLLALGLIYIRMGHWPRRTGDEPHCPKCDYILLGIEGKKCPECGSEFTPAAIVRGHRVRHPGLTFTGVTFVLLGIVALVPIGTALARGVRWYELKPAFLVLRDFESNNPSSRTMGWRELMRRHLRGQLSASNYDRIVAEALKQQAAATPAGNTLELLNLVATRFASGALSDQQKQQFFKQMQKFTLHVRNKVVNGDEVPYAVETLTRSPIAWQVRVSVVGIGIDDQPLTKRTSGFASSSGIGGNGRVGWSIPSPLPGDHTMKVIARFEVVDSGMNALAPGLPLFKEDRELSGPFTVLLNAPPDLFKVTTDEKLGQMIRSAMQPDHFAYGLRGSIDLAGTIQFKNLPSNIAFDVFARFNGHEYQLNSISQLKGANNGGYSVSSYASQPAVLMPAPPPQIDIILRSSEKVARQTVEIYDFWQGEIVYADVPVRVTLPAGQTPPSTIPSRP